MKAKLHESKPKDVYITYVRTTPKKLWQALTSPEFTRQYWYDTWQESEWKVGDTWKMVAPDGRIVNSGKIIEIFPTRRLVLKWHHEFQPGHAEGYARMTYEIEKSGDSVKLSVIHEFDKPDSKFFKAISNGWPLRLSSLKSLLETGESLKETRYWPKGM